MSLWSSYCRCCDQVGCRSLDGIVDAVDDDVVLGAAAMVTGIRSMQFVIVEIIRQNNGCLFVAFFDHYFS